jgi:hypothetical protein
MEGGTEALDNQLSAVVAYYAYLFIFFDSFRR